MPNEKEKRYSADERSFLKDILPLETPLSLTIESSSACNFRCNYCSNSLKKDISEVTNKILKYEDFINIIDDFKDKKVKLKALNLSRMGEPLLNKNLPDMIAYAKQSGVFEKVILITNGSMLNPTLNQKLIDSGLDRMLISVQGLTEQKYLEVSNYKIDFDKFVKNISHFYNHRGKCKLHIKAFYESLDEKVNEFYKIFTNICDELSIEHVVPYMHDVDYNNINCEFDKNRYGDKVKKVDVCPLPFYTLSVLSNGNVGVCCNNNHDSLTVGNIHDNTVLEIWNSDNVKAFRKMQISGDRYNHPICGKCNFPVYGTQESDNLENISDSLKEYYLKKLIKVCK